MKMNNRSPYYSESTTTPRGTTIKKKNDQTGVYTNILRTVPSTDPTKKSESRSNKRDMC